MENQNKKWFIVPTNENLQQIQQIINNAADKKFTYNEVVGIFHYLTEHNGIYILLTYGDMSWGKEYLEKQGYTELKTIEELREVLNVKESLPKKWCIKRTSETAKVINEWFNKKYNYEHYFTTSGFVYSENVCGSFNSPKASFQEKAPNHDDFTEITFDQFKKWILKDDDRTESRKELKKEIRKGVEELKMEKKMQSINELTEKFKDLQEEVENWSERFSESIPEKPMFELQEEEIVGWKMKEKYANYTSLVVDIINTIRPKRSQSRKLPEIKVGSDFEKELKESGVLNIWLEPIFKEKEVVKEQSKDYQDEKIADLIEVMYQDFDESLLKNKDLDLITNTRCFLIEKLAELTLKIDNQTKAIL